ncbi:aminopeptidase P family N-terminal domain-containing protein [Sporosarcina sp. JAI121]|uniref:aminopeptidase P family N-terminal domain-containing protein n=1 Tax=Sporosarcina sp. JAI121 TaxID=2723064 RepID=UPI0015C76269|nr:aminopeptidase P family N-terminal domain-containing protein [Sporosarcina sp. JAI121]NYF24400.1 Xaa-Pro aminopeptidase [Sporosarcina sp. JAI121]
MEKLMKFRETFDELGIEGILIMHAMNRRYLTDFTESAGTVVVTKTDAFLLVDFRYVSQAKAQVLNFTVKVFDRSII